MSFGVSNLGSRLLLDVKSPPLLPYQDETVRGITQEINTVGAELKARREARGDDGRGAFEAVTLVQDGSVRRLKRALLVYHASRCERIEALRWSTGTVLPAAVRETLHNSEVDYFRDYCSAYSRYSDAVDVDLMAVRAAACACGCACARPSSPQSAHPAPPRVARTDTGRVSSRRNWTVSPCAQSQTAASCRRATGRALCARARRTSCRAPTASRS